MGLGTRNYTSPGKAAGSRRLNLPCDVITSVMEHASIPHHYIAGLNRIPAFLCHTIEKYHNHHYTNMRPEKKLSYFKRNKNMNLLTQTLPKDSLMPLSTCFLSSNTVYIIKVQCRCLMNHGTTPATI